MVSSRLANRLGTAGGPRRRPVTDAREVLNARAGRVAAAPNLAARRLGVASRGATSRGRVARGIVKTGIRTAGGGLRLNTMRSDLIAGGSGLRSDRILAATRRNFVPQTRASPRFQMRNLRQPAQVVHPFYYFMLPVQDWLTRGGASSVAPGDSRLCSKYKRPRGDIDERIPLARNKRIQVNPHGISVTTANPFVSPQQGLFGGRASLLEEEDDDLERLTLDNILGRSPFRAATAAAAAATAASLTRSPRATSSLSRIQHRLDGGGAGVTESDIRDLFQYIGPMHDARMVAVGTALATFHRQSDAMKAFKAYNGRMLDGQPMNLTVLTLDFLQSNQR
ncbi:hypothetical protein MTO96_009172 [Rhipicephalus appendiculatus]